MKAVCTQSDEPETSYHAIRLFFHAAGRRCRPWMRFEIAASPGGPTKKKGSPFIQWTAPSCWKIGGANAGRLTRQPEALLIVNRGRHSSRPTMPQILFIDILSLRALKGFMGFGFFSPFPSRSSLGNICRVGEPAPFSPAAPFDFFFLVLIRTHLRLRLFPVFPITHIELYVFL